MRISLPAPSELPGPALPIDAVLPQILAHLQTNPSLVIEAPPGAGKTTRVPLTLLLAGLAAEGELLVLQPRRLAARLSAQRVAELLGEEPGDRIGYQVRFESRRSARTRLTFMTEGLLTRRLRDDPQLRGVAAVILDEFHERHLDGDLALALLHHLQRGPRPELRLIVMSATLDGQPIADFLDAPRVVSAGRAFPVEITHQSSDSELPSQVLRAFHERVSAGLDGDLLVFLPGAREIHATAAACAGLAAHAGALILPLHGDLTPTEQDRAIRPAAQRKLILSTNVAETSVTIDGVTTVIDSGLARIAAQDPWSGISTLQISKISRASAAQRAGRAGRTRPGRCIRLYSQHDLDRRPEFTPPEIARLDLTSVLLDLHAALPPDLLARFPWFEAPPPAALAAAEQLLTRLGALDSAGRLSHIGHSMLRFPTHPRLARLLLEGERRRIPELCASAAALLSERSLRRRTHGPARIAADADLLVDLADLDALTRQGLGAADRLGIHPGAARQALQARDQLCRLLRVDPRAPQRSHADEICLRQALLLSHPDRVAQVREEGGQRALALAGGGAARLAESCSVLGAPWVLALAVEERKDGRGLGPPQVTSAAAIEPEWLFSDDLPKNALEERDLFSFDTTRERVLHRSELRYFGLLVESTESRPTPAHTNEVSAILREAALAAGPARFADPDALAQLHARSAFIARFRPDFPLLDDTRARAALAELCEGCTSFAELKQQGLLDHLTNQAHPRDLLHRWAPTHLRLPGGRELTIHYAPDQPPWLSTRLQDLFGAAVGPTLAEGRVPIVLHLLAPNGRDLQVTTDLAGFWDRHYPELRRALMRRYPRHAWPEDPRSAAPPAPPTRRSDRR